MPSGSKKRKAAKKPKPEKPSLSQAEPAEVEEEDGMCKSEEELTYGVSLSPKAAEAGTETMVGECKVEADVETEGNSVLHEDDCKASPPLLAEAVQRPTEADGLTGAEPEHGKAFEVASEDGTPDDIKADTQPETDAEAETTPYKIKAENSNDWILQEMVYASIDMESDSTPSGPDESETGTTAAVVEPETNTGPDMERGIEEAPAGVEPVIEANTVQDSAYCRDNSVTSTVPAINDLEINTGHSDIQSVTEEATLDVQHDAWDAEIDAVPVEMEVDRETQTAMDPTAGIGSAPVEVLPDSETTRINNEAEMHKPQDQSLQEAEREDVTEVNARETEVKVVNPTEIESLGGRKVEHEAPCEVEDLPDMISRDVGEEVEHPIEIEWPGEIAPEAESDVKEKVETPDEVGFHRKALVEVEVLEDGKHEPQPTVEDEREPIAEEAKHKPVPDMEEAKHEAEPHADPEPDLEEDKNQPEHYREREPEPDLEEAQRETETHVRREPEPDLEEAKDEPEPVMQHAPEPDVEVAKHEPKLDVEYETEPYVELLQESDAPADAEIAVIEREAEVEIPIEGGSDHKGSIEEDPGKVDTHVGPVQELEPAPEEEILQKLHLTREPGPDLEEAQCGTETHVRCEPEPDLEEAKDEPEPVLQHAPEPDVEVAKHEPKLDVEYETEPYVELLQESDAPADAEIAVIGREAEVEIPIEGGSDHKGLIEEDAGKVDTHVGPVQELEPSPEEEILQELHLTCHVQMLEEGEAGHYALIGTESDFKVPTADVPRSNGETSHENPPEPEVVDRFDVESETDQASTLMETQQDEESPPETENVDLIEVEKPVLEGDEELWQQCKGVAEGAEEALQQRQGGAVGEIDSRDYQSLELLEHKQDESNLGAAKGGIRDQVDTVFALEEATSFFDAGPTAETTDNEPVHEEEFLQRKQGGKKPSLVTAEEGEEIGPVSDEQMVGVGVEQKMGGADVEAGSGVRKGAREQVRAVEDEVTLVIGQDATKLVKQMFVAEPAVANEGGVKMCNGEEEMAAEVPPTKLEKGVNVEAEDKEVAFDHGTYVRDSPEHEAGFSRGVEAGSVLTEDVSGDYKWHPSVPGEQEVGISDTSGPDDTLSPGAPDSIGMCSKDQLDSEPTTTNEDNHDGAVEDLESAAEVTELTQEAQGGSGQAADVKQLLACRQEEALGMGTGVMDSCDKNGSKQTHDMSEAKGRGWHVALSNSREGVPFPGEETVAHKEVIVQNLHKQSTVGSSLPVVVSDVNQRASDHENPKSTEPTSGGTNLERRTRWLGCCGMLDALLRTS